MHLFDLLHTANLNNSEKIRIMNTELSVLTYNNTLKYIQNQTKRIYISTCQAQIKFSQSLSLGCRRDLDSFIYAQLIHTVKKVHPICYI